MLLELALSSLFSSIYHPDAGITDMHHTPNFSFLYFMLGMEPSDFDMLGNCTTPGTHPQPYGFLMAVLICHADTFLFIAFPGNFVSHWFFPWGCYL